MDDHSPPSSGVCHEFKPTVDSTAKRLLDSSEQVQALQSAKKACVPSHDCSTPDPAREPLLCSPGPACFQGSPCFLGDAGHNNPVASSSASKYDDVAVSLDTSRCFDGSEPDDALLELSDSEEGNSPFNFTEEEIQEILADDCVGSEQYLTRKTSLSQNVDGGSEKDESRRSSGASAVREGVITENPNEPLSRESSSVSCEGYPSLLNESAGLGENLLQSTRVTHVLFDVDIQELLNLSPIDAGDVDGLLEDNCLKEAEKEALETASNDKAAHSWDLEASLEELMSNGWQSLRKTPTSSHVPDFCGVGGERCMTSATHSPAEGGSVPLVLMCSTPSPRSESQELPKATKSCFSRKLSFPEGDEDSTEAEQPSNSMESGSTAGGQIEQEEATSGKKPGNVIPVPQEEEESLKQWICTLEAEFEPFYPEGAHPYEESCSSCNSLIQEPSAAEGERKVFVNSRRIQLTCPHKQHHNNDENFPCSQLLVFLCHLLHCHLICTRGKRDHETQPQVGSNAQVNSSVHQGLAGREPSPLSHASAQVSFLSFLPLPHLNLQSISCECISCRRWAEEGAGRRDHQAVTTEELLWGKSLFSGPVAALLCLWCLLVPSAPVLKPHIPGQLSSVEPGVVFQWDSGMSRAFWQGVMHSSASKHEDESSASGKGISAPLGAFR